MQRIRLTIRQNPTDPADDLRYAARLRRDLWAHSPVEIDPDSPVHGTHRDLSGNAYFEIVTNYQDEVRRILHEREYESRVSLSVEPGTVGPPCDNCGNIAAPVLPTVCPTCSFRNISPCPHCNREIPRQAYLPIAGDLFRCPMCQDTVRLHFHDPLFNPAGYYNQPLVVVESATEDHQ